MRLTNRSLSQILHELPDLEPLKGEAWDLDLLIVVLGFEERAVNVSSTLVSNQSVCRAVAMIEYQDAVVDNNVHFSSLMTCISKLSSNPCISIPDSDIGRSLRAHISSLTQQGVILHVGFDMSGATVAVILDVLKELLAANVHLSLFYSEAKIYYPLRSEYESSPDKRLSEETGVTESGVTSVTACREFPGQQVELLPHALVMVPGFNVDRTKAMLAFVDEGLVTDSPAHVTWIVGTPHLEENSWRSEAVENVNEIEAAASKLEASTFFYKDFMRAIDAAYNTNWRTHNITIGMMGSKLQVMGTVLYCFRHPEIRVLVSAPKRYMLKHYSEGVRDTWCANFGSTADLRSRLLSIDELCIED